MAATAITYALYLKDLRQIEKRHFYEQSRMQLTSTADSLNQALFQIKDQAVQATSSFFDPRSSDTAPKDFLLIYNNFISVQILKTQDKNWRESRSYTTPNSSDLRFANTSPVKTFARIHRIQQKIVNHLEKKNETLHIRNMTPYSGLATASLFLKTYIPHENTHAWVVFHYWQTGILDLLTHNKLTSTTIIDDTGRVFASHESSLLSSRKPRNSHDIKKVFFAVLSSGAFTEEHGRELFLTSYTPLKHNGLTVIMRSQFIPSFAPRTKDFALSAILLALLIIPFQFIVSKVFTSRLRLIKSFGQSIAQGKFGQSLPKDRYEDELSEFSNSLNDLSKNLNDIINRNTVQTRLEQNLLLGKLLQNNLLPPNDFKSNGLRITSFFRPAIQSGGDIWGHFELPQQRDLFFIADATGRGFKAATAAVSIHAAINAIISARPTHQSDSDSPAWLMQKLNDVFYKSYRGEVWATCMIVLIDSKTGTATYCNAGHPPITVLPKSPQDPRLSNGARFLTLQSPSPLLGMQENMTFKEESFPFTTSDKFILYSDGITDTANSKARRWGKKSMMKVASAGCSLSIKDFSFHLINAAFDHYNGNIPKDDITLVSLEIDQTWQAAAMTDGSPTTHLPAQPSSAGKETILPESPFESPLSGNGSNEKDLGSVDSPWDDPTKNKSSNKKSS